MNSILLIVPCFNEANRLDLPAFEEGRRLCQQQGIELTFLMANDGSTDNTKEILDGFCKNGDLVYHAPQNMGKGNLIQAAFQHHKVQAQKFDWTGYWDADLATPLDELPKMIRFLEFYPQQSVNSIWCSRISRLGSQVKRQMHRHYLGRIFVTIISVIFGIKPYDSQCGAKLFRFQTMEKAMQTSFISRWIFDVEILLRIGDENIVEYPVQRWEDIPGSKVKIFKEIFRVWGDILKIKRRYL